MKAWGEKNAMEMQEALSGSEKGLALLQWDAKGGGAQWSNAAFASAIGWKPSQMEGASIQKLLEAMGPGAAGLMGGLALGKSERARWRHEGKAWRGTLEVKAGSNAAGAGSALLWLEDDSEWALIESMLEEAQKKASETAAFDEKTGFMGSKAFWRAVSALWAVCARQKMPVALAMMAIRPAPDQEQDADFETAAKLATGKALRRSSDLLGRLSTHSFAVFMVGEEPHVAKQRIELINKNLGEGFLASTGLSCGIPELGSNTNRIKSQSKRALDQAFQNKEERIAQLDF